MRPALPLVAVCCFGWIMAGCHSKARYYAEYSVSGYSFDPPFPI